MNSFTEHELENQEKPTLTAFSASQVFYASFKYRGKIALRNICASGILAHKSNYYI